LKRKSTVIPMLSTVKHFISIFFGVSNMGWIKVGEDGDFVKTIYLKYSKRGVSYYISYTVVLTSRYKMLYYLDSLTPFTVWCGRKDSRKKYLDEVGLINWVASKKLPMPRLPYITA